MIAPLLLLTRLYSSGFQYNIIMCIENSHQWRMLLISLSPRLERNYTIKRVTTTFYNSKLDTAIGNRTHFPFPSFVVFVAASFDALLPMHSRSPIIVSWWMHTVVSEEDTIGLDELIKPRQIFNLFWKNLFKHISGCSSTIRYFLDNNLCNYKVRIRAGNSTNLSETFPLSQ